MGLRLVTRGPKAAQELKLNPRPIDVASKRIDASLPSVWA
jgi:hypothetical protein